MSHARTPVAPGQRPTPEALRPKPDTLARCPSPGAPCPTLHTATIETYLSAADRRPPTPDSPARPHTIRHCNAGNPRAGSEDAFATIRPARQAPTAPHTAPHTGTRLPHASVAHFDMLYFNLSVAGVPLFAERAAGAWGGRRLRSAGGPAMRLRPRGAHFKRIVRAMREVKCLEVPH